VTKGGFALSLKLGSTLNEAVQLGTEFNLWARSGPTSMGNWSVAVYLYPAVTSGFFVKGGAGLGLYSENNGGVTSSGSGFGFLAGLGYDFRVSRSSAISVFGNYYHGSIGNITQSGTTVATGWKQHEFDFGIGSKFH